MSITISTCLVSITSSIELLISHWFVLLFTSLVAYLLYHLLLSLNRWLSILKIDDNNNNNNNQHSTCNKMIRLINAKSKSGNQEGGGTTTTITASSEANTGSLKITSKQTSLIDSSKSNSKVIDFNYHDIDFDCQSSVDVSVSSSGTFNRFMLFSILFFIIKIVANHGTFAEVLH